MPTTCGFPNCKFRSRYRGSDDIRHFYRVPKKPSNLRLKWLEAIGRTEETIVSQLRVCSGHFEGGEKREGDVPVADPATDRPLKVDIPPKVPRHATQARKKQRDKQAAASSLSQLLQLQKTNGTGGKIRKCPPSTVTNNATVEASDRVPSEVADLELASRLLSTSSSSHSATGSTGDVLAADSKQLSHFMQTLLAPLLFSPSSAYSTPNSGPPNAASSFLPHTVKTLAAYHLASAYRAAVGGKENRLSNYVKDAVSTEEVDHSVLIIDPYISEWSGTESNFKVTIVATAEEALYQTKTLGEWHTLIVWEDCVLTNETIDKFTGLRTVVKIGCGVGFIDRDYLKHSGIQLHEVMASCVEEVADNVLLALLSVFRGEDVLGFDASNNNISFSRRFHGLGNNNGACHIESCYSAQISAKTHTPVTGLRCCVLGIIGGGVLEQAVASRARAFGIRVLSYNSSRIGEYRWNGGAAEAVDDISILLASSHCLLLNTGTFPRIGAAADTLAMHARPGCTIIDLHNCIQPEKRMGALNVFLRSKHISLYIQNYNNHHQHHHHHNSSQSGLRGNSPPRYEDGPGFILSGLTSRLSAHCQHQLRQAALDLIVRENCLPKNPDSSSPSLLPVHTTTIPTSATTTTNHMDYNSGGKSPDSVSEPASSTKESGSFSIKSLADN